MSLLLLLGLVVLSFGIALVATRWLVGALGRGGVLDRPNKRSSHTAPTPRGGGLGIIAAVAATWGIAVAATDWGTQWGRDALLAAVGVLAILSFRDDLRGVPWSVRLAFQLGAILVVGSMLLTWTEPSLPTMPIEIRFDTARLVPMALGLGAVVFLLLAWLWLINAFNFMDGIDGIAATEAIFVAGGAAFAFWFAGAPIVLVAFGATLAAAAAGFLVWNWAPARIFMGDVGSVPLGFLLGFLLLCLVGLGLWGAALALPAYFYADATLTLVARLLRGASITEAHREHFYQRAAGLDKAGHAAVVRRVVIADSLIVGGVALGLWLGGMRGQLVTILIGALVTASLLAELTRLARRRATSEMSA